MHGRCESRVSTAITEKSKLAILGVINWISEDAECEKKVSTKSVDESVRGHDQKVMSR